MAKLGARHIKTVQHWRSGGKNGRDSRGPPYHYAYFQTKQRRDALTGHGSRVLALTPAHLRKPAAPNGISANTLLPAAESAPVMATENSVVHYRHYFRREELYRLVWTSPVSEIAARLGVSDVALAKLCRRAGVPIPGRGYWQRTFAPRRSIAWPGHRSGAASVWKTLGRLVASFRHRGSDQEVTSLLAR